jgi:hypothetical protein
VAVDSQVKRSLSDWDFDWFLLIHSLVKRCLIETLHFSVKWQIIQAFCFFKYL